MKALEEIALTKEINAPIAQRNEYGQYPVDIPKKGRFCIIAFSNIDKWGIDYDETYYFYQLRASGITEHALDSNKVLIRHPKNKVKKVLLRLNLLPLYDNSFENRKR
jgi:hypothetical protein